MLIQLNNITKNFVVNEIFSNVKLEINDKDRVAIVGRNGAGKSTLLKIIAGAISFDSGERTISKNTTVGYLSQEFIVREDLSIYEEMITCFDEIITLEAELEKLSFELTPENIENNQFYEEKLLKIEKEKESLQEIVNKIEDYDINNITPMDAMKFLFELKENMKKDN